MSENDKYNESRARIVLDRIAKLMFEDNKTHVTMTTEVHEELGRRSQRIRGTDDRQPQQRQR